MRVEGRTNAEWLLCRLSQFLIVQTPEPIGQEDGSNCCTFNVASASLRSCPTFDLLLASIPEVKLMWDSA
jgi:hypothetical protein